MLQRLMNRAFCILSTTSIFMVVWSPSGRKIRQTGGRILAECRRARKPEGKNQADNCYYEFLWHSCHLIGPDGNILATD